MHKDTLHNQPYTPSGILQFETLVFRNKIQLNKAIGAKPENEQFHNL